MITISDIPQPETLIDITARLGLPVGGSVGALILENYLAGHGIFPVGREVVAGKSIGVFLPSPAACDAILGYFGVRK